VLTSEWLASICEILLHESIAGGVMFFHVLPPSRVM
jgi:hypothetical protein